MIKFVNIEECEKEINYLREQNQKLIDELSQVSRENSFFRDQLFLEHKRLKKILDEAGKEHSPAEVSGDDEICLN